MACMGCHNTEYNDIQHNDTPHKGLINDTQKNTTRDINDTQHNNTTIILTVIMLSVIMLSVMAPKNVLKHEIPKAVWPDDYFLLKLVSTNKNILFSFISFFNYFIFKQKKVKLECGQHFRMYEMSSVQHIQIIL